MLARFFVLIFSIEKSFATYFEERIFEAITTDPEAVQFLINENVDINSLKKCGSVLLHSASNGRFKIVELLLKANASIIVDNSDENCDSPLVLAALNGHVDVVQLLINHRAYINHEYTKRRSAARYRNEIETEK